MSIKIYKSTYIQTQKEAMAAASSMKLKLLIDTKAQKVLFAEASKDFVDFLFCLLSLPVGSVIRLLKKSSLVGSFGKLYASIENLNETYIQPNQNKNSLLNPRAPLCDAEFPLLLSDNNLNTRKFYTCANNNCPTISDVKKMPCPRCKVNMTVEMSYAVPAVPEKGANVEGGFVKGVVTYMVMDDLEVRPMSTISSIAMLSRFNVKDVSALEERIVDVGISEGLKLLKASMECRTVLSSVYVAKD